MTRTTYRDPDVRAALEELRMADERSGDAPSFDTIVRLPVQGNRLHRGWAALGIAATLLIAVVLAYRARMGERLVVPREVVALSAWRSPTHALIDGATSHLIIRAPNLGASVLDSLTGEFR